MKLSSGHRKLHETFVWPAKVSPKVSLKLSDDFRMATESFSETFAKLSHDSFFDACFRPKNHIFQLFLLKKMRNFTLDFVKKNVFRLNFLQKMTFSLICPNDVFFFTETFSQKLTNLSEISHVIPCCVSLFASKGSHFHL